MMAVLAREQLTLDGVTWSRFEEDTRPLCLDCAVDTLEAGEWYMVRHEVWARAVGHEQTGARDEFLCIGCLEQRLGRRLARGDFLDVPVNDVAFGDSPRLTSRKRDEADAHGRRRAGLRNDP